MNELSIKVNIANREYPLTVKSEEVESVKKAAIAVNEKVKEFEKNYTVKDKQDLLAMCALQFASQLEQKQIDKSTDSVETRERLKKMNALLSQYIEK